MDLLIGIALGACGSLTIWVRRPLGMLFYSGYWEAALLVFVIIVSATFGCAAGVEWARLR